MKRVLGILAAKWFVTLVGAIALSLVVWFIGPLVAVADTRLLEGEIVRILVVMAILVVWGLVNIFSRAKAAKTNEKMVESLAAAPQDKAAAESAEEVALLRRRLEEALTLLRKSVRKDRGGRYLYQLPWYMLIGPPGSGKTTALQNSGLNFPLAEKLGRDPLKGVGGTRNCDWWLTDQAVLLDTAGRYTTQDSNQAADQAAWKGFLGLLSRFRPRQPVNGALVAIGLADVALLPANERLAHARAIRQRLRELQDGFGIRFPVYVLLTKADLIAGFVEFFDDLGREEREQVWGTTLPFDGGGDDGDPAVAHFGAAFDALVQRLNDRLLERLQRETDLGKRALIYDFPAQVASLKEPLLELLNEIFMPNRYEGRLLLRGVYLTSGTQEGTPIDRLMGAMASSFGIDRQRLAAFSGSGRGYFLARLFREVVFAEASVVSSNPKVERRQAWLRRGGYAAAACAVLGLGTAWTTSYIGNRGLVGSVETQLDAYRKVATPFAASEVADGNIEAVLPALRILRGLPGGYDARGQSVPVSLTFGLYQGDKLGSRAVAAYRHGLNTLLLPRLLVRLGDQIRGHLANADYVQEALKVYLMLGAAGPLDKAEVRAWLDYDWRAAFPGADKEALRRELAAHLDALLEAPLQPVSLDGQVIDAARRVLRQSPLASRAYAAIKRGTAARQLPEWRIVDHAGPAADRVFVRKSGKSLSEGVPGFYTYAGYYKVLLPSLATVARDVAKESWVLGDAPPAGGQDKLTAGLERDIAQLYVADYVAQWDGLLGDIGIVPFRGMQQASEAVNILSAPNSPLKLLLTAVAKETTLTRPPEAPAAPGAAGAAVKAAAAAASRAASRVASIVGKVAAPAAPAYGQAVDDHFRRLHEFVGSGGDGPAPIGDVLRSLNDLYLQLNRLSQPGQDLVVKGSAAEGGLAQRLAADATRLPPPVSGLVAAVAHNSASLAVGGARAQINDNWQSKVLPFCRRAIDNRYPIFHDSRTDITLDDFAKLFAPNGLLDQFFTANLKPFVDTSRRPWRWQKVDNVDLGIAPDVLLQFQRAAAIRDGFFAGGAATPSLRLQLLPVRLDAKATQVLISIDGQDVSYSHGPPRPTSVQWPGKGGVAEGRVAFLPPIAGQPSHITTRGPWSLFRLFDAAKVEPGPATDRVRLTFAVGGRKAVYEVQANSVINPLTMPELREFRCPSRL